MDQFSELCDLFSINVESKSETSSPENNSQTQKTANDDLLKPSRSSTRLASKKIRSRPSELVTPQLIMPTKTKSSGPVEDAMATKKRKRSLDSDDFEQRSTENSESASASNENSLDSSGLTERSFPQKSASKHVPNRRRDSNFNESLGENSNDDLSSYEDDTYIDNIDDNSNDREFKSYVRRYQRENNMVGANKRSKKRFSLNQDLDLDTYTNNPVKKESNKEAATRYRLKKLSEKDKLFESRMHLEKENDDVKKKIELAQTEISYLKNLLVQMLLTKGVL